MRTSRRYIMTGAFDPKLTHVFSARTVMISTKYASKMNGVSADRSSNVVKRQGLGEMSMKKLPGLLERFRWFASECFFMATGQLGHHFQCQPFNCKRGRVVRELEFSVKSCCEPN